jgi:predicted esterase
MPCDYLLLRAGCRFAPGGAGWIGPLLVCVIGWSLGQDAARPLKAQESRFELGQRLQALEAAYETADAAARRRATPHLQQAVRSFFQFKNADVAQSLDLARFALRNAEPTAFERLAAALHIRLSCRLIDATFSPLVFSLEPFYEPATTMPADARLLLCLQTAQGNQLASTTLAAAELPLRGELPLQNLPEGDHKLTAELLSAGQSVPIGALTISVASSLKARLARLESELGRLGNPDADTQRASIAAHVSLLKNLAEQQVQEANAPAHRLLTQAEQALQALAAGGDYFGAKQPGDFWITLVGPRAKSTVRLMAPQEAQHGHPLPLVLALHGAGGSEHMFFAAYGNGKLVDLCGKRGWLLVSPKVPLLGGGMALDDLVNAVERLYPVDRRRVFIVGHSMGASRALAWTQLSSQPPAAVAALGGEAAVTASKRLKQTRFFIGVGSEDFVSAGARRLAQRLQECGASDVRFKEYADTEHLAIVQVALQDVIEFFDEAARQAP